MKNDKPVEVVVCRFGVDQPVQRFATLRDALRSIECGVEFNEDAPRSLRMPSSIIGSGMVEFESRQIYAMLELVREKD